MRRRCRTRGVIQARTVAETMTKAEKSKTLNLWFCLCVLCVLCVLCGKKSVTVLHVENRRKKTHTEITEKRGGRPEREQSVLHVQAILVWGCRAGSPAYGIYAGGSLIDV